MHTTCMWCELESLSAVPHQERVALWGGHKGGVRQHNAMCGWQAVGRETAPQLVRCCRPLPRSGGSLADPMQALPRHSARNMAQSRQGLVMEAAVGRVSHMVSHARIGNAEALKHAIGAVSVCARRPHPDSMRYFGESCVQLLANDRQTGSDDPVSIVYDTPVQASLLMAKLVRQPVQQQEYLQRHGQGLLCGGAGLGSAGGGMGGRLSQTAHQPAT